MGWDGDDYFGLVGYPNLFFLKVRLAPMIFFALELKLENLIRLCFRM
jgi:hypothetical protein